MRRFLLIAAAILLAPPAAAATIPSPDEFLGRKVGEDRFLAPWPDVVRYLRALDATSDRISIESAGLSTLDNEMPIVVLTSEANQRNLPRYREIARRLAKPDDLEEAEARALIDEGKTIVLVTCTIHSTEVGSTQMAMLFAHQVATTEDPEMLAWLDEVILLLMPSINPDGQVMVVDWYRKHLGTEFEGGPMPWLYHHYVGHDNNRDFYMLTQKESRAVNEVLYHRWFPQVFLDEHQMGSTGPRMFVPPQTDPVAPEIDSMILRHADLLGTLMGLRLEEAGKKGVGRDMIYDSYWPGGTRNTAWWKNVVGLLTEVASARIATPIRIEPGELRGGWKGLPEYGRRANYLSPWEGGWWRLRDIIDYEMIATRALLEGCARQRRDLLENIYRLGRNEIEKGRTTPPHAFVIPAVQHDPTASALFVDLLLRHGVRVESARTPLTVRASGIESTYPAGSHVVRSAQPYRPFILTMLQPQRYPEVPASVGGPILPPYDVTSWSLPISMGVDVVPLDVPLDGRAELDPVAAVTWPGPALLEGAADGYLIPHAADGAFIAMNRLLERKVPVHWLRSAGAGHAMGDIWIPPGTITAGALETVAREARVPVRRAESRPTGSAWRLKAPRVGLYKPWVASMDEGWTRWLMERYEFPHVSVTNEQIKSGAFARNVDVLLLPDVEAPIIREGKPEPDQRRSFSPLPPPYGGGLGNDGGARLKKWVVEEGGTIVALDSSTAYVIDLLDLPVTDVLRSVGKEQFSAPGSMLRIHVDTTDPLAYGMRREEAAYFADSPAFQTRPPDARFDRRVVASYPEHEDRILISGYLLGGERLKQRAAVVDVTAGTGRVVLIGFRAQHRAQPHRTFKLLFNALYLPGLSEATLP